MCCALPRRYRSMGDSISEGTIRAWQKQVGEAVKVDDIVVVIETDKVRRGIEPANTHIRTRSSLY